jgi:DNA-binding protein HU-beta
MNKKELLSAIAEKSQLTLAQVDAAFSATFETIQQIMKGQGSVAIPGFGSFGTKDRAERKGRNPSTGQEILIPKATVPVFKPGSQLKDLVNTHKKTEKK